MTIKRTLENSFYSIPIVIISNIIYLIYSSKFPGGIAGMAPFILMLNSIISFIISLLIFLIISIRFELNQAKSIMIFTSVSFIILYFYFGANPFNYSTEEANRDLNLWLYISILIPTLIMLAIKKIIVGN